MTLLEDQSLLIKLGGHQALASTYDLPPSSATRASTYKPTSQRQSQTSWDIETIDLRTRVLIVHPGRVGVRQGAALGPAFLLSRRK